MSRSWKTVARERGISVSDGFEVVFPDDIDWRCRAKVREFCCFGSSPWAAICRVMDEQDFLAQVGWI